MSESRAQRRARERAMRAAGVELVAREHLPLAFTFERDDASALAMISVGLDHVLTDLVRQGADVHGMLAITIGDHPSFPGSTTIEAKAARRKAEDLPLVGPTEGGGAA